MIEEPIPKCTTIEDDLRNIAQEQGLSTEKFLKFCRMSGSLPAMNRRQDFSYPIFWAKKFQKLTPQNIQELEQQNRGGTRTPYEIWVDLLQEDENKPPVEGDSPNLISGGLNHGMTPQAAGENLNAAYHQLVLIQVFTTDLENDLKKCGLKHCALLCNVVNDSLDLINTKVVDRILTARGA